MIPCKAWRSNGSYKYVSLPKPEQERQFLTEIKTALHIPGDSRMVSVEQFYKSGFTHITDQNGKTVFPKREIRPVTHREHRSKRHNFGGLRPVAALGGGK